jgi:hypothetical protein
MRSGPDAVEEVVKAIRRVYERPVMFGDANEVDSALYCFHWCWAMMHKKEDEYRKVSFEEQLRHESSLGFPRSYRRDHKRASEDAVLRHVLGCWSVISTRIGIDLGDSAKQWTEASP